jgi:pyruvate/2-oxoglutarate dehydrogenase complex dihydrolipoamide acyltransferase (E2) component
VSEVQNLQQQIQQQIMQSAKGFYGDSLGRLKGQLQNDRAQLESLMEQSPPEAQAQLQEMIDSYTEIEGTLDQAAHDQGLDDVVSDAAQQAQDALGQVTDQAGQGVQDTAGQAAGQAQDAAGQAVGQVTETAGQATQGVQDAAGQATQQAQDTAGQDLNITDAARQKADELGVDLSQVEGTGAEGRITVKDVTSAANQ